MPHSFDAAAKKHLTQGMTEKDMDATSKVAIERNEIIIFRATGPWPQKYIERGTSPTKDMGVKGKSSTWGPMAGCVPVDANLSKAMDAKGVEAGNGYNKKAIAGGKVKGAQLTLDEAMIKLLSTEKLQDDKKGAPRTAITDVIVVPERPTVRYLLAEKRDGAAVGKPKDWAFLAKKADPKDKEYEIFYFPDDPEGAYKLLSNVKPEGKAAREALEKKAKPLEVLVRPAKPECFMTGDYDLFAICPSWGDFGGKDIRAMRFMDDPAYEERIKRYQSEQDPRMSKTLEDALKAAAALAAKEHDAKKYKGFLKNKIDIEKQLKGKEAITKAAGDSMKIVCSGGCVDPENDNDPLEFRPDDEVCRKCKKPAMALFYCKKGCPSAVKDKKGKPKRLYFMPGDEKCPKCGGPPDSWKAARDYEDGEAMGNVTFRVVEVIAALNKAMGANDFNKRVHHNQEAGRFHAPEDITEAFPLTVFHPTPKDHPLTKEFKFKMAIIDELDDLKDYFKTIFKLGYFVPLNFAWEIKNLNATLAELNEA